MAKLAELKGIVARLQASLEKETINEFKSDILSAIRYNKRRVCVLERRVGIGLTVCLCVGLLGCEPPVMANVSGYCNKECCCGVWAKKGVNADDERVTSSQHVIRPGDKFIAAPANIPFGTMITVPGYGRFPVEDRGGAIKGNKLDLYFCDKDGISGHQRALNFGRQQLMVIIERKKR